MKSDGFLITFRGKALENQEMDVRDLAPALLSLGEIFREANMLLNESNVRLNVNVRAMQGGSFCVDIGLVQTGISGIFSNVSSSDIVNLIELILGKEILGIGGGVIGLILWLKNRKIKKTERDGDKITIVTEDGDRLETSKERLVLLGSRVIRERLKDLTAPLRKEGVTEITFSRDKKTTCAIRREEREFFAVPEVAEEDILNEEIKCVYTILAPDFEEGNKWRVSDGSKDLYVSFEDQDFIARVQSKEISFRKEDMLICNVHMRQFTGVDGKFKTTYTVKKVLEQRAGKQQLNLLEDSS